MLVTILILSAPVSPAQEVDLQKEPKKSYTVEVETSVETMFSSNPFHYSEGDLDDFDDEDGDGERFDDLDSEWDVITTLTAEATCKFPVEKGRKLRLGVSDSYHKFLLNPIGDYNKVEGKASYDITRIDKGILELGYTSSRFKKNYKLPSGEFDAAEYDQLAVGVEYERELNDHLMAGIGYEYKDREYNSDFDARDRDQHTVFAQSEVKLRKRLHLDIEVGYSDANTGDEERDGVTIDRSFESWYVSPSLRTRVRDWDLALHFDYSQRDYSTDERSDEGRYDRTDDRYGVRVKGRRKLPRKGLELVAEVGWRTNDADPEDSSVPTDETGYDEYFLGLRLDYSF